MLIRPLWVERSFSVLRIGLMLRDFKEKRFVFNGEKGGADGDHHSSEEGPEREGAKPGYTAKLNKGNQESEEEIVNVCDVNLSSFPLSNF